ncbi:MAG: metallophosphoesterase [Verrucomicrobiota bacterium]
MTHASLGLTALAQLDWLLAAETGGAVAPAKPPKIGFSSRATDIAARQPAVVSTASPKVCRILQFTDLHLFHTTPADDRHTLEDCRRQIEHHHPDLIVLSGDLWHENPKGRGQGYLEFAVRQFAGWGRPWATCWGNHDLLDDYQRGHDTLAAETHSLYRGGETHGDYRVEVHAPGAPALDLFLLNSSDVGLTAWQARALAGMTAQVAARGPAVPALLFFHVPIQEYETRLTAGNFSGLKLEGVSHYNEHGDTFPTIVGAKQIKACFCGHNHLNDFVLKTGPVDLNFGRSTGYAGYGGDKLRKGAKLIEVDLVSGGYQQRTVFASGATQFGFAPPGPLVHAA